MVEIVPERQLEPGIYGFDYTPGETQSGGWERPFVVNLSQVNQTNDCIDLVQSPLPSRGTVRFTRYNGAPADFTCEVRFGAWVGSPR